MISSLRLIAVVVVLLPGAARSQSAMDPKAEEEAAKLLTASVQLMDAGHLPEARTELERVIQLVPDKPNPYRLIGLVDFRMGHCREAIGALETFLAKVGPNDRRVTEVISIRDKCKEDLAPKLGSLVIDSTPHGASVRLDDEHGEVAGQTPYTNNALAAGAHVAYVELAGFRASSRGFTIQKSEKLRFEFALQQNAEAVVSVKMQPAPKPVYKRGLFWGLFVGGLVVAGGAVGVGLGFGLRGAPFNATLPAFSLGLSIR